MRSSENCEITCCLENKEISYVHCQKEKLLMSVPSTYMNQSSVKGVSQKEN